MIFLECREKEQRVVDHIRELVERHKITASLYTQSELDLIEEAVKIYSKYENFRYHILSDPFYVVIIVTLLFEDETISFTTRKTLTFNFTEFA